MTDSGQVITDADGLGLGLALGLALADGLALALGEALAEADSLGDGDADSLALVVGLPLGLAIGAGLSLADELVLGVGSGVDSSTDSWADGESCGAGSSDAVGSSVPVRAVMVSDADGSGADSLVSSTVGEAESVTEAEGDALGDGEADGALLGDGDADADGDSDGEGESDAVGDADDDGETDALGDAVADGEALTSTVGSQRAGTSVGITQVSGSSAAESSVCVDSSLSLSTTAWLSCSRSAALAGNVEAANDDATTASEAVHDTIVRSIGASHLPRNVATFRDAEGKSAG